MTVAECITKYYKRMLSIGVKPSKLIIHRLGHDTLVCKESGYPPGTILTYAYGMDVIIDNTLGPYELFLQ